MLMIPRSWMKRIKILTCRFTAAAFALTLLPGGSAFATPLQLLLETDANAETTFGIFGATFDSMADLLNGEFPASSYSDLDLASSCNVGGLTCVGSDVTKKEKRQ